MGNNKAAQLFDEFLRAPAAQQPQLLRALRSQPTSFPSSTGAWVLTSYADCKAVLVDHAAFGTDWPQAMAALGIQRWQDHSSLRRISSLLMSRTPPAHARLRRLINQALSPAAVDRLRPTLAQTAAELVTNGHGSPPLRRLADQLPLRAVGTIIGVPAGHLPRVAALIRRLNATLTMPVSTHRLAAADRAVTELDRLLKRLLHERDTSPRDDLLSVLLTAHHADLLDHQELLGLATTVLGGGLDTASPLLLRGMKLLIADPALHRRVQASQTAEASMFNEVLRLVSPVRQIPRTVLHRRQIAGHTLHPGEMVTLLISAANRDPHVYPVPDAMQTQRHRPRPLSFGSGIHACPGVALTRSLFATALRALEQPRT